MAEHLTGVLGERRDEMPQLRRDSSGWTLVAIEKGRKKKKQNKNLLIVYLRHYVKMTKLILREKGDIING